MTDQKPTTQYTITAASRVTGKSRTTIQKHLKQGKLSASGPEGNKRIDASELIRVYGDDCDFARGQEDAAAPAEREEGPPTTVRTELHSVRQQLDTLEEERRREREQLQAQIEHLRDALKLAQEGHNRATLLLENQSGGGDLRATAQRLEKQFARSLAMLRAEVTETVYAEVREQPWWQVAFRRRSPRRTNS